MTFKFRCFRGSQTLWTAHLVDVGAHVENKTDRFVIHSDFTGKRQESLLKHLFRKQIVLANFLTTLEEGGSRIGADNGS